jgi:hypothetical protein
MPEAEKARSSCLGAFRALDEAQRQVREVESRMAAHADAGTAPEPALAVTLDEAQKQLDVAGGSMPGCNEAVRALRMALRSGQS